MVGLVLASTSNSLTCVGIDTRSVRRAVSAESTGEDAETETDRIDCPSGDGCMPGLYGELEVDGMEDVLPSSGQRVLGLDPCEFVPALVEELVLPMGVGGPDDRGEVVERLWRRSTNQRRI